MLIRVTTDQQLQIDIPAQNPDGEHLEEYRQFYREWKPGDPGSMSWEYPDGGWVIVPGNRIVAVEALPEPDVTGV